jgi:hypothetical protein
MMTFLRAAHCEIATVNLTVVSDDQLVGMCTRTDVLRARGRHLDHERFQDGWKPVWLRAMRRPRA